MTVFTNTSNRPWGVVQDDYANSGIADAEGNWVIEPSAVTPEDADLIVRAVNAHDALVAALESALRVGQIASKPVIARIEAALEAAK